MKLHAFQNIDPKRKDRLKAMAAMVLVAISWACLEMMGCYVPRDYTMIQIVWFRYLVHILFMIVLFGPRKGFNLVKTNRFFFQVGRSLLMLAMPLLFVLSLKFMPLEQVLLISWASSLMVLMLSKLMLRESASLRLWLAGITAWIGVWVMSGVRHPFSHWGLLAPAAMGFCFALYVIMTRMLRFESTCANLFHTAFWVLVFLTPVVSSSLKMPSKGALAVFAGIGICGYVVLYFLDKAMVLAPPALTAPLILTQPLWHGLMISALFDKTPAMNFIIGGTVVISISLYLFWIQFSQNHGLLKTDGFKGRHI